MRSGFDALVLCATCGKNNADGLVFCEDCGARLAPRIAPPTPPIGVPMPPVAAPAEGTKCPRCNALNAPGMRFCITCGSPLEKTAAPVPVANANVLPAPSVPMVAAAPIASAPIANAPIAPVPVAAAPIAPAPVVALSPSAPSIETRGETRLCRRCNGASDKNAQFCRFCGASLAESTPAPHAPQPMRPTLPSVAVPAAVAMAQAAASSPQPVRLDSTIVTSSPLIDDTKTIGRLVVVQKDGGEGASFPLLDQIDIGRESGECVFADDRYMAPRHARLTHRNGALFVRDLGTPNGVYMRLRKEPSVVPLEDQDLILLGQQVLRFEVVKDAEAGFGAASEQGTLVFGTPAAPRYARLSQRTTEGVSCDVFHVRKPETVFGRESGDVVFPEDPFMSRRHAAIRATEDAGARKFTLGDLGSSNGTFIRIRGEVALLHGDEIRVGQQLLRVDLGASAG